MEMFISASIAKNIEPKRKFVSPTIITIIILDILDILYGGINHQQWRYNRR